jgi:flagellar motor switch protein FliG
MNSVRKAAVLLQNLDQALLGQILALLPQELSELAMRVTVDPEPATADELNIVLRELKSQPRWKPVAPQVEPQIAAVRPREMKSAPLDESAFIRSQESPAVEVIQSNIVESASTIKREIGQAEPGPFGFLNDRHPDDIRRLLLEEQPQTIAVITAQLSPALSATVLAGLPPDRQAEVLERVARLGPTDPEILADIAAALKGRMGRPRVRLGGVSHAAAVLRQSSRTATRTMLASLDEHDSDLADELRQTLFSFDDLLKLDDDTLRVILQETDDRQWALALKASPEAVRQKVLGCLSSHVAQAFRSEMDALGPVRLSEMTSVRQQIADSIHRLESSGLITLPIA